MNTWEQSSYTAIEIENNIACSRFVVPQYQRGLVWSNQKKEQFVDTLKRGLPFGTILLYHDEKNQRYQIIDGLQRCSTIYSFINHPAPFFTSDDLDSTTIQELVRITGIATPIANSVENAMIKWVQSTFQNMDEVRHLQYSDFARAFVAIFPSAAGKEYEIAEAVKPTFRRFQDMCENLCSVRIPAIIIKGDDDALPEIFERINSKGTQLSKYQIYAATWNREYILAKKQMRRCDIA